MTRIVTRISRERKKGPALLPGLSAVKSDSDNDSDTDSDKESDSDSEFDSDNESDSDSDSDSDSVFHRRRPRGCRKERGSGAGGGVRGAAEPTRTGQPGCAVRLSGRHLMAQTMCPLATLQCARTRPSGEGRSAHATAALAQERAGSTTPPPPYHSRVVKDH